MPTSKSRKRKPPKRVLALPGLEHAKTAVLNSLSSVSGQRTYEHAIREFVAWYVPSPGLPSIAQWCSDTGSTSNSAATLRRRSTYGWPRFAVDRRGRHHARPDVPRDQQGRPGLGRRHVAEGAVRRRARRRRSGRHRQAGTPRPQTHVCPSLPSRGWRLDQI